MNANPEFAFFARLVESLTPWLDQLASIGGWAHRLHRLHPLAQPLQYEPLATLDADVDLPRRIRVAGDEIYQRLAANGFEAEFLGHHRPPAAVRAEGSVARRCRGRAHGSRKPDQRHRLR